MKKEEILEKSKREKPAIVGEMENNKISKGNWISVIIAGIIAVIFIIVEGALRNYPAMFAISSICYAWACALYIFQYVLAKRPPAILIGAILHGLAFVTMVVLFVLSTVQAW